ncbi:dephospho-CoA kinase [Helicobacter suis]|uniref:dephospho-CoA kinase n=2 Tax=Helicobacter suis TaxID=104628 RepID=UPI0001F7A48C|nr:dephospho-CoA kinase [Helicobacter suis]EFX43426.1 dephospho-CoA kinase [Helicobacter suis HS1]
MVLSNLQRAFKELKHAFVLTGGIATGKSTVGNLLSLHGFSVLDADKIAHGLFEAHNQEIAKMFMDKQSISRQELAPLIFNNQEARAKLEAFLHPKIREQMLKSAQELEKHNKPYFLDIPLYYEIEGIKHYGISQIVLVYAPRALQIERLQKRDSHLSLEQIEKRLSAQLDIEFKKSLAPFVLDNSKDLKYLQEQVQTFIQKNLLS